MKSRTKINIIGIIFSGFALWAGYSVYACFFNNEVENLNYDQKVQAIKIDGENVSVMGDSSIAESFDGENEKNKLPVNSIISSELFEENLDAPRKNPEYGMHYVGAHSAIAIDADTHTILFDQDAKKKMAIASLTKVMTAILVIENIDDLKSEIVTIDEETVRTIGTIIGCPRSGYCLSNRLRVGEKISAQNLLEALLMNSTNDAAVALARHIAGDEKDFARMMNEKARELGLGDTNFCNASGLDEDDNPGGCYSTAYDFSRISAYALKYDIIWNIMRQEPKDIYSVDGQIVHHIVNTDVLVGQMPNCIGGKTGFTYEAGKSLMTAAHHPYDAEKVVIAVILNDNQRWADMKDLMTWTFGAYNWPTKD
ncbi:MAG: hypothetical protein PF549_00015 [Patescibacteria group bacterium]|jgi:D-alanyl-D-alanine carboxypeptidase (penicillin-binding protein 5/6)|nr:hypothetical protein [Patescibacteria group bacterium]